MIADSCGIKTASFATRARKMPTHFFPSFLHPLCLTSQGLQRLKILLVDWRELNSKELVLMNLQASRRLELVLPSWLLRTAASSRAVYVLR
jgi:hypothetical protein